MGTSSEPRRNGRRIMRWALGFWVLLGALWLANLPFRPLFDPDEGRYAEIPREMLASGDWVTPTLNGLKYFEKPPLQYWATAGLYDLFGVHEWTARLWSAALAFLCIPMVFVFARRIGYASETAMVAAALLAVNPYFALTGQLNLLDQGFSFFLSAAVFSFVVAQREISLQSRPKAWLLPTWCFLALAVLSKGVVALVLAAATLVAYSLVTRDVALLRRMRFAPGISLFLLVTLPWFWLAQSRNPAFAHFFFVHEHLQRYFTPVHERVEPVWFFVPIVVVAVLPLVGNWRGWTLKDIEGAQSPGEFRAELFLLLWCGVVVLLFSFSDSKLATYVMPVMPALAVVLARVTAANSKAFPRAKWISVGFLLATSAGVVIVDWWRQGAVSMLAILCCLTGAIMGVVYLAIEQLRSPRALSYRWAELAALSIAGYQFLGLGFAASLASRSGQTLAMQLVQRIPTDAHLYSVGQYRQTLTFYLRRPVDIYDYSGELDFGMRQASEPPEERGTGAFLRQWRQETRAIAFMDPGLYVELSAAGMPGHIVARDARSVAVARS
jgi:4-amino-4-deoxy-L-arabinose transferase-like glycosyltransferase